jgi:hypothetical protein
MATETCNVDTWQQRHEEPYDWRIGPCANMTWDEWAKNQLEMMGVEIPEFDEPNEDAYTQDDENDRGNEEELVCPPTPRASSIHSIKKQLFKPSFSNYTKSENHQIETPAKSSTAKVCPDAPKKAKTRAERRALDTLPSEPEEENADFQTPVKKERRTDYWVHQDALRMKRARSLKSVQPNHTWSDEEPISPLNPTKRSNMSFELCLNCQIDYSKA